MNTTRNKIIRAFMLIVGIIMIIAGIIVIMAEVDSFKQALIDNFAFFLSGGILIYLGLTWKKKQE